MTQLRHWLPLVIFLTGVLPAFAAPRKSPPEMIMDAELHDVCFVNERLGWAVGDRGVILHTDDGGATWNGQVSAFSCRWRSVHFVDAKHGWIVGGWTKPFTHRTVGVVLRTTNGGRTWVRTRAHVLPSLRKVKFLDRNRGWACGNASSLYPAGIFRTEDGGHSWTSFPTSARSHWHAGTFFERPGASIVGVVAGKDGRVGLVQPTGIRSGQLSSAGLRTIRCLEVHPQRREIWMVGDAGMIQVSRDGGVTFLPLSSLPADAAQFDFYGVSLQGSHCWIVGAPGSRVLHSADAGRTWAWRTTGSRVPLRSIQFLTDQIGFAVGTLGTILNTRNGGETWQVQRRGGRRLAMLAVYADAHHVPWEMLAKYSGNRGYLSAVDVVCRRDVELGDSGFASAQSRLADAATSVGASVAWTSWSFPIRQRGLSASETMILRGWDAINQARGRERLQLVLARRIRQWQPEVVVSEMPTAAFDSPAARLVGQAMLKAIELAADAEKLPPAKVAGLPAWQVKKLYGTQFLTDEKSTATVRVHAMELSLRLGRTLGEHAIPARELVHRRYRASAKSTALHLLVNRLPNSTTSRGLFRDLVLNPGTDARRKRSAATTGRIDTLTRLAQRRRNAYRLMTRFNSSPTQQASLLSQFEEMIQGLGPIAAGEMLFQLGETMRNQGQLSFAADAYEALLRRYPTHELSETAAIWLAKFYTSAEVTNHLLRKRRRSSELSVIGRREKQPKVPSGVRTKLNRRVRPDTTRPTHRRISSLMNWVQKHQPSLQMEPQFRFPVAAWQRQDGLRQKAEGFFSSLANSRIHSGWRMAARGEQWLARKGSVAPQYLWKCAKARSKPKLDGILDDSLWKNAQQIRLRSRLHDDQSWPGRVLLAYDDQFLYLAVECRKAPEHAYEFKSGRRSRDADLKKYDRVQLMFDVDRDMSTFYKMEVDYRGWTFESCFGDKLWNPTWYVAQQADQSSWRVEAAIVLDDLVHSSVGRQPWAVGVQRIVPQAGFQSWSQPAAIVAQPQGFGYLLFESYK